MVLSIEWLTKKFYFFGATKTSVLFGHTPDIGLGTSKNKSPPLAPSMAKTCVSTVRSRGSKLSPSSPHTPAQSVLNFIEIQGTFRGSRKGRDLG